MNNDFTVDSINRYIDQLNGNATHYDISVIVYKVFKNMYRYLGSGQWQYYDFQDNSWKPDKNRLKFKNDIKTIMSDFFLTRYLYWYEKSQEAQNIDNDIHSKFMADKMFRLCQKMKDDKFISVVIKEAKGFFDIYNDD